MFRTYLSRIESGRANPTLTVLHGLAAGLGVSVTATGYASSFPSIASPAMRWTRPSSPVGLHMGGGGYTTARVASSCRIVALLPYEGHGPLLYRVRSDAEAFERVIAEIDLTRG